MRYQIEEFWLDAYPLGRELCDLIERNYLDTYELHSIEERLKPQNPNVLQMGNRSWYIVRFRKRES